MKHIPTPPAKAVLYRVTYVDSIFREAYVEAHDEDEAQDLVEEEIGDGVHHHAYDADQNEMQAWPAEASSRQLCFECGH